MTPDGWRPAGLPDVASMEMGETLIAKDLTGEGIPVFSAGRDRAPWGYTSHGKKRFARGTIILGARGTIGFPRMPPFDTFVSTQTTIALTPLEGTFPTFLKYALDSQNFDSITAKQAIPMLTIGALRDLRVLLPPLAEQRKIAAILSSVDEAIEATQAVLDQLHVVKKAMMAELLTRGLPGRHARLKQTEIGEIPETWQLCVIDDLGIAGEQAVRSGPFGSSMKTKDFRTQGVKVLTIQSLGEGTILHDGLFFVDEVKAGELVDYKVRMNDVVFSRVADIGRCAAIGKEEAGWLISPNLSRIRLDPAKADARFLMYLITMGKAVVRQVEMVAGNGGRPVISSSTLRQLRLPAPPLEEQRVIAAAGVELEARIGSEARALAGLGDVKAALMAALLTGEVRVSVAEEPA